MHRPASSIRRTAGQSRSAGNDAARRLQPGAHTRSRSRPSHRCGCFHVSRIRSRGRNSAVRPAVSANPSMCRHRKAHTKTTTITAAVNIGGATNDMPHAAAAAWRLTKGQSQEPRNAACGGLSGRAPGAGIGTIVENRMAGTVVSWRAALTLTSPKGERGNLMHRPSIRVLVERGDLGEDSLGCSDQIHRQGRAVPSPSRSPKSKSGSFRVGRA